MVYRELPERLANFGLSLAANKTRLMPFGNRHWHQGQSHPYHFDFLGFRHHLGTTNRGRPALVRIPTSKSTRKFLVGVKEWLKLHRHDPPKEQQGALRRKLTGFYQYFSLPHTTAKLKAVHRQVLRYWLKSLERRSQTSPQTWAKWQRKPWFPLPAPQLLHPKV